MTPSHADESPQDHIDGIIDRAFREHSEIHRSSEISEGCLDEETIRSLYEGTISDHERQRVLLHLDTCGHCGDALASYYEMANQSFGKSVLADLARLKAALPQMLDKLNTLDILSLERSLSQVANHILEKRPLKHIATRVADMVRTVGNVSLAGAVATRGDHKDDPGVQYSANRLSDIGHNVHDMLSDYIERRHLRWPEAACLIDNPQLWLLERMTEPQRHRAMHIRDWCEEELELLGQRPEMRYLPSYGMICTKNMLRLVVDILKVYEPLFTDPLSYFMAYTTVYCYHLGLLLCDDAESYSRNLRHHGKKTWDLIIGNPETIHPAWPAIGFSCQQEALMVAGASAGYLGGSNKQQAALPRTQSVFLDGTTYNVPLLAISLVARLADSLNYGFRRLPDLSGIQQYSIPDTLVQEYMKHETISEVTMNDDGIIHVTLRTEFKYPKECGDVLSGTKQAVEDDVRDLIEVLRTLGINLAMQFSELPSLFPTQHPFLGVPK